MNSIRMFYFGPWAQSGHHFRGEDGRMLPHDVEISLPWGSSMGWKIDGGLIPNKNYYAVGVAHVTHEHGWTAISFWDMSVDSRPASHSTYIAEGTFTFEQMVETAKTSFAARWNRMGFEVRRATLQTEASSGVAV